MREVQRRELARHMVVRRLKERRGRLAVGRERLSVEVQLRVELPGSPAGEEWPIPLANATSTVEWQSAQVMPIETRLSPWKIPLTPTTEFVLRSAIVFAGSSSLTT